MPTAAGKFDRLKPASSAPRVAAVKAHLVQPLSKHSQVLRSAASHRPLVKDVVLTMTNSPLFPLSSCDWSYSLQRVSRQIQRNHQTSGRHAKHTYAYRVDANHMPEQARAELHQVKEHSIR